MEKYILLQTIGIQGLHTLLHLLDKAKEYSVTSGKGEVALLSARLAPDMFDFTKQIQISTDDIRRNLYLLAGKDHVKYEDNETTLDALKDRVEKTLLVVSALTSADFSEADNRHISLYFMGGKYVLGKDFVQEFAFMNYLFHVVTAYDILRATGVSVGKTDFITKFSMHDVV